MPFHKFIPSYHHHFGRQCRVADYGYTKLKDLFEALPHVIQVRLTFFPNCFFFFCFYAKDRVTFLALIPAFMLVTNLAQELLLLASWAFGKALAQNWPQG